MKKAHLWLVGVGCMLGLTACVDDDYDLSDIDLSMTVGGEYALPFGSTEELFMDKLLDIDDESSIRVAETDGEYSLALGDLYLFAESDEKSYYKASIGAITVSGTTVNFDAQSVNFISDGSATSSALVPIYTSTYSMLNAEVTNTIQAIDVADVDCDINVIFTVSGDKSSMQMQEGFYIEFPEYIELAKNTSDANVGNYKIEGNRVVATGTIDLPCTLKVKASRARFADAADGEYSFTPGNYRNNTAGNLKMSGELALSGNVAIEASGLTTGQTATVKMGTVITIGDVTLNSMDGIVDPEIKADDQTIWFGEVPDVLQDEETDLDWTNPQIYLGISNPTDIRLNVGSVNFTTYLYSGLDAIASVDMGTDCEGTLDSLIIENSEDYLLCISKEGVSGNGIDRNVRVESLSDLLRKMPDHAIITDINANVIQETCHVDLGTDYDVSVDYSIVCPLCFGDELFVSYTDTIDGWHDDIDDEQIDGVIESFVATMTVISKVPIELLVSAIAIDSEGNQLPTSDYTIEVSNNIEPGSVDSPTETELTISVTATEGIISTVDGIVYHFEGTTDGGDNNVINQNQSVQITNVKLKLRGQATFDLDEL